MDSLAKHIFMRLPEGCTQGNLKRVGEWIGRNLVSLAKPDWEGVSLYVE